ncbi:hypothetical protein OFD18_32550, partial [Escherichia coli]|nr:hypothetical protein [Escherichia coli]
SAEQQHDNQCDENFLHALFLFILYSYPTSSTHVVEIWVYTQKSRSTNASNNDQQTQLDTTISSVPDNGARQYSM